MKKTKTKKDAQLERIEQSIIESLKDATINLGRDINHIPEKIRDYDTSMFREPTYEYLKGQISVFKMFFHSIKSITFDSDKGGIELPRTIWDRRK